MSRVDWTDELGTPGQFALWAANCRRSLRGKAGQRALRELEAALLALPVKELAQRAVALDGQVCAVGAVLAARKANSDGITVEEAIDLLAQEMGSKETQADIETVEMGEALGMPHLVAWSVVWENDEGAPAGEYILVEGPARQHEQIQPWADPRGVQQWQPLGADKRYAWMLAWVRHHLQKEACDEA